jgi:AAA ATPase domain
MNQQELRKKIWSAFGPFEPARPETYVDCQSVRGDWDVLVELGSTIVSSEDKTCQLFSGHRGSGKSTELTRRLNDYLTAQGYFVVYFAADAEDIEPGDAQYADILLSCIRHIGKEVPIDKAIENPLIKWLTSNWSLLENLIPGKMSLDEVKLEGNLVFGKIITTLRTVPEQRQEIRRKINEKTSTLLDALNEFIAQAKKNLPVNQQQGIVLIVDNLDRIPNLEDSEKRNCREIYINHSGLMRGLNCHVIYTVPVSMVYSSTQSELRENYGSSLVLPMLVVRHPNGQVNRSGLDILRQLVRQRLVAIDPDLGINMDDPSIQSRWPAIFESSTVLDSLCLMSGGRVRVLMHLIQGGLQYNGNQLTITEASAQRAVQELAANYSAEVLEPQWAVLARVAASQPKTVVNNPETFKLLRNGLLLEYRYYQDGELIEWQDVHPLIAISRRFKEARRKLEESRA